MSNNKIVHFNYIGQIDQGDIGVKNFQLGELFSNYTLEEHGANLPLKLSVELVTENTNGQVAARVRIEGLPQVERIHTDVALSTGDVKAGDTVHLKAGGPPMTVEVINIQYESQGFDVVRREERKTIIENKTTVDCVWFTSGDGHGEWHGPFRSTFALALLDSKV